MAKGRSAAGRSSIDLISRASSGETPEIERMPRPTIRTRVAMRDGVELDTWIWLPFEAAGPVPAILIRTPYQEHVLGWARLGALHYRDAGYAVVFQLVRGVGGSGGHFTFSSPLDRPDGYDTVEWIAAQPWCDGAVGMDGSSYAAMTQLAAASAAPPHLRCIVPAVISANFFRDVPRFGGIFSRQHALGWTELTAVDGLADLTPGMWGDAALLGSPDAWERLLSRPAIDAADGVLSEDRLQHYRDVLEHSVLDEFWHARTIGPDEFARISIPVMVVTGLFDGTMGSQHIWHMLERHAPESAERLFLLGPWDHGEAYVGGESVHGPWAFERTNGVDLPAARLAFFDRHLKGVGPGPRLPGRSTTFVNAANRWLAAEAYPHPDTRTEVLHLHSDGLANLRGHGSLLPEIAADGQPPDRFESDPTLPFVPVAANLDRGLSLDLRERERLEDTLVYTAAPERDVRVLHGEFSVVLHVAVDTPDCDLVCWLAVVPAKGGRTTAISRGLLRLRYREGFDRERPLPPDTPVEVRIDMNHVGHALQPGDRLRLLIGSSLFPLCDPNPNTGEPIATGVEQRTARISVLHGGAHPSRVCLPVIESPSWSEIPAEGRAQAVP